MSELARFLADVPLSYQVYPLRNSAGKTRWIEAPNPVLKRVQRMLLRQLLYQLEPHAAAHGFVPGRSIVTNARPHVGRRWVVTLDVKDFFPSTPATAVRQALERLPAFGAPEREAVLKLVTRREALPQGAPTSPHLANLCCLPLDQDFEALSRAEDLVYTRYADDLTFSGDRLPGRFVASAARILEDHGYVLAASKTRIHGQHRRQTVTGLVVNEKLGLPRPLRRWLRAVLHDASVQGLGPALEKAGQLTDARLAGYLALLQMIQPDQLHDEIEALKNLAEQEEPPLLRPEAGLLRRTAGAPECQPAEGTPSR